MYSRDVLVPHPPATALRVLQFNTLADALADTEAFPKVDPQYLEWQYRKDMLVEEIVRHEPDVVVLEEVDHFADHFEPVLKDYNYTGFYQKREDGDFGDKTRAHGVAIFLLNDTMLMKRYYVVPLTPGSQIAMMMQLEYLPTGRMFYLAGTHLKAKLGHEARRLQQFNELNAELKKFMGDDFPSAPIIIAGDLNAEPNEPVIQQISSEYKSAYDLYWPSKEMMVFSSYKERATGVEARWIDYIFHTAKDFKVTGLLGLPSEEDLPYKLPAHDYPSDHLAIMVQYEFK